MLLSRLSRETTADKQVQGKQENKATPEIPRRKSTQTFFPYYPNKSQWLVDFTITFPHRPSSEDDESVDEGLLGGSEGKRPIPPPFLLCLLYRPLHYPVHYGWMSAHQISLVISGSFLRLT